MRPTDILGIALSTFIHNKMRTFLTVFGISIGIGAIVFLLSLGYGVQKITIGEITNIKALSAINITSGSSSILDMSHDSVLKFKNIEGVVSSNPNLAMSGQIGFGPTKTDALINAAPSEYAELDGPTMVAGTIYTDEEKDKMVLTMAIANAFNMTADQLIGQKVKITAYIPNPLNDKQPTLFEKELTVSGIIKENSASYSYIPLAAVPYPDGTKFNVIKLKVNDISVMKSVKNRVVEMGYKAVSLGEKIDEMNKIFDTVKLILIILGAVGLFVASIGMFNTLTISLLERTKDIGIMKSLGATDGEIYAVFLTESALIAFMGGVSGVAGAVILGNILNGILSVIAMRAGGDAVAVFQVPLIFVAGIIMASLVVGLLTGFYPARRAAGLNPLDALRYE